MVLQLHRLFSGEDDRLAFEYELDLSSYEHEGCRPFVSPVAVSGVVTNSSGVVELAYQVGFVFEKPCDRCADLTRREYSFSFQHVLVSELNEEDTGELLVVEEEQLDMDELAVSDILLELPMKFLCSPDCRGLCPVCGNNRNTEQCNCSEKQIDPRMEVLKSLIEES